MHTKLFIIPWLAGMAAAQVAQDAIAHQRTLYELLQRQQQINQAILMNNALIHSSMGQQQLAQTAPTFFIPFQQAIGPHPQAQGILTHTGFEKKEEVDVERTTLAVPKREVPTTTTTSDPRILVEAAHEEEEEEKVLGEEDLEVVSLFKKLNLTKEETKSIVQHVEHVVREELARKLKEKEAEMETSEVTTTTTMTTTSTTTTSTTPIPTTTSAEYDDDLSVFINRNNLKHHPVSKAEQKKSSEDQSSIKTSDTHLPVSVQAEEEIKEDRPRLKLVDRKKDQKASLHKRILITRTNEMETDRDLLVDFATGAPLDLGDFPEKKETFRSTSSTTTTTTSEPGLSHLTQTAGRHASHHTMTKFEKLAVDYRRRLENTGDLNKILQKLYQNAYISLVERGSRRIG